MKRKIKKTMIWFTILLFVISSLNISASSQENIESSDIEDLKFKQELKLSIDTSLEEAKHQAIDIHVNFDHLCWAKDELHNSVRICYEDTTGLNEIESQIYDLEYEDESHIKSCNIVFLIPDLVDGNEKYFVCYDSSEIDSADYEDHILLEDTHFFFEPIPGQKIDFDYYEVKEDGFVTYAIVQKGELIGNPIALSTARFRLGTTEVDTNKIDQLGVFDFRYGIVDYPGYYGTAWAEEVDKKILVDGNLMIRVRIQCNSPKGDVSSDNIYTYYYCPTDTKKIYVNVNHRLSEDIEIKEPTAIDGGYAGIVTIKSRSASISKMNVGNIMPLLSAYGEDNVIKEFDFPADPDSEEKEYILTAKDDCDLGDNAWVALSDPTTGKAHGLLFNSNTGLIEGEEDGIQAKAYASQNVKLPGLEADSATLTCGRNAYELGGVHNTALSMGFDVNLDVEFITFQKEGADRVDAESQFYQTLIKDVPLSRENQTDGDEDETERFSLTTYVHLAPSIPLGSLLSAALGKPLPYIYAEIYKDNSLKSSGAVGRISLTAVDFDLEGLNLLGKIQFIFGLFDWRNVSFFKRVKFPDLEAGTYVVKIFKENPILGKDRKYIGYEVVDLEKDETILITCRPQGSIKLSIFDQSKNGVKNAKFMLEVDGQVIANEFSDGNGTAVIYAPCYALKPYVLKTIYKGFLVEENNIAFGLRNSIIQLKQTFSINHHNLRINVKDSWDFAPEIDVNPKIFSKEMIEPIYITAEKIDNGKYVISNLYPADYTLSMGFKSFEVKKDVSIYKDLTLNIGFPAEYNLDFNIIDSYGQNLTNGHVLISRQSKEEKISITDNGNAIISVPPGKYEITVFSDNKRVAQQEVELSGNKEINILTSVESSFHQIIIYIGIALVVFSIVLMSWKKNLYAGFKLLVIGLLITSIVSPWWVLNGIGGDTSTTTQTLLYPPRIVTLTSSSDILGGDVSQVPPEVTMVLSLLSVLITISCMTLLISIYTKEKYRKTTKFLSAISFLLIFTSLLVFLYAMLQLTEVGVGSFIGNGTLEINLPGLSKSSIIPCNWGAGVGFYLGIISIVFLLFISIVNRKK